QSSVFSVGFPTDNCELTTDNSGVFEDDALENVRHGLALVDATLHVLVDVFPLDHLDRIDLSGEERSDGLVEGDVSLVLELLHPDAVRDDTLLLPEGRDRLDHLAGDFDDGPRQLARDGRRRRDLEEGETAHRAVDQVDDVVEANGELVNVLPVDRRDERPVDPAEDLVGNLVALVLEPLDLLRDSGNRRLAAEELVEDARALMDARRHVAEPVEVLLVAREYVEHPTSRRAPCYLRESKV